MKHVLHDIAQYSSKQWNAHNEIFISIDFNKHGKPNKCLQRPMRVKMINKIK